MVRGGSPWIDEAVAGEPPTRLSCPPLLCRRETLMADPYYTDDWLTVFCGDARAVMAEMPAESVHCVVTSPP